MGKKRFFVSIFLLCAIAAVCAITVTGKVVAQDSYEMEDDGQRDLTPGKSASQAMPGQSQNVAKKLDNIISGINELKAALSDIKKELNTVKIRVTQSQ